MAISIDTTSGAGELFQTSCRRQEKNLRFLNYVFSKSVSGIDDRPALFRADSLYQGELLFSHLKEVPMFERRCGRRTRPAADSIGTLQKPHLGHAAAAPFQLQMALGRGFTGNGEIVRRGIVDLAVDHIPAIGDQA